MSQPTPKEYLFNETKIVQDIITRMGHNSFLIKGWAVSLVVVSLLFEGVVYHHFIALIPWIVFWGLDAYFLQLERLYRQLYDWLIKNRLTSNDYLLSMNIERFREEVPCKIQTMFSKTLLAFYGSLLAIIISVLLIDFVVLPHIH
jgi:hypothetical protein